MILITLPFRCCVALLFTLFANCAALADDLSLPNGIQNNQDPKDVPLKPVESLKLITVPDGFNVSLYAGEPHVRQPIAFAIDDRGRLWVAECYSYREWKAEGNDRILIFEDTDNDGQFDQRKVFWDKGNYLTGIQLGFGGVWICNSPNFAFIPDRDGDDVPDSEPVVLLDGWSNKGVHNVLNGLTWGPEGWLYGCNGITAPSKVGKPGTPDEERIEINCGIWRYHPTRHEFEAVAHGTTNPWGLDYDQHGQFFFTNCVIDHLWHLIPGAHYKRMFGEDYNSQVYGLLGACSDHLHWAGKDWTKARGGDEHDSLGGGHAHCGAMIYLGYNWPAEYSGSMLTCNVHGNRVNRDVLKRRGSGYVGEHAADCFNANDPWFRGVELKYGPDGGVFITDWTDLGECHDRDGVHRDSGRIYKVVYEANQLPAIEDLSKKSDRLLLGCQFMKNEFIVRHARRILQERAGASALEKGFGDDIVKIFNSLQRSKTRAHKQLRLLWTLHAIGETTKAFLAEQLSHESEHIRWWAIQLLCEDRKVDNDLLSRFADMAKADSSALVRLSLASALQRLPLKDRWPIATNLASHAEDGRDANLPLMIWYAVEPAVAGNTQQALLFASKCKMPVVRQHVARRLAED